MQEASFHIINPEIKNRFGSGFSGLGRFPAMELTVPLRQANYAVIGANKQKPYLRCGGR